MPQRKTLLVKDEIYHVFNRGVARMPIFPTQSDFMRFVDLVEYYRFVDTPISFSNFKKLQIEQRAEVFDSLQSDNNIHVEIFSFCLMDNHYHFLVKQVGENGIATWMRKIQNAYAKYFNMKHDRSGPLFQPMFKAVRVQTDEQLLHVSRYIHLNPSTGHVVTIDDLPQYPWSSLTRYFDHSNKYEFVNTELILGLMNKKVKYKEFVFDQAEYQRELAKIKHLILE
jgi:putative transposase